MEDLNWHCQMTVLDGPSPDRTTEGARLNKHVVIAIAIDNPRTNQKSFSKLKWAGEISCVLASGILVTMVREY